MVKGTITYRPAIKKDIPQLVALMNAQYQRKINTAYFKWQYFSSAYPTILFCALEKNNIVGMFGLQKKVLSNKLKAGQAIDMLIAPLYRGQGIFKKLADLATGHFKDLDLLCVLPNSVGKNAVVSSLGWKNIGKLDVLRSSVKRSVTINSEKKSLNRRYERPVHFRYTEALREWRFKKNPTYTYYRIQASNQIYAMVKIFTDPVSDLRFGDIVDIHCPLNESSKIKLLIVKAMVFLSRQKVKEITMWALEHLLLYEILLSLGFKKRSQERYFCVKMISKKASYLKDLKKWHLVQADTEFF